MTMPKRILFVDDEPNVLAGLQRSLHSMRNEWIMKFAASGQEALEAMAREPFDVLVTDMRMPGMGGAQLLDQVREKFPQTVRMVLSGQCDRETILTCVEPTHQYLSKPCEPEQLKTKIAQAFALRDLLENPTLQKVVARLKGIPSLPAVYQQIMEELRSREPSPAKVGKLIAQDMGMTAKTLQLVNSAFFGLRCHVSNPIQAANLLGLDTVRALVLSTHIFSQIESGLLEEIDGSQLWNHSIAVSGFAKAIANAEHARQQVVDDSLTAGLLHDTGKLILACAFSAEYKSILDLATTRNIGICAAEREVLGCSHAEIGGYLLGIWGLPQSIVEAVAWHHRPSDSPVTGFSALLAVHAACVYDVQLRPSRLQARAVMDQGYLARVGLEDHAQLWQKTCEQMSEKGDEHE